MPFLFFLKKNTNIFTQADLVAIFDSQKTFDENSVLTENLYEKASITEDEFNAGDYGKIDPANPNNLDGFEDFLINCK